MANGEYINTNRIYYLLIINIIPYWYSLLVFPQNVILESTERLYKATTDYTKPQKDFTKQTQTIQRHTHIIQRLTNIKQEYQQRL